MFDEHPIPDTTCDAIMKDRQEKSKDETTIGGWIRSETEEQLIILK